MQATKLDYHRIFLIATASSLFFVYLFSWVDVITDSEQRTASDFMAFYAAGRSMLETDAAAAYDLVYLKINEEGVLGFQIADQDVNPFVHPPFILPILWLAAHFDYISAFYIFVLFMLMLCVISAQFAVWTLPVAEGTNKMALWLGIFLFFPLFISLVNGQDTAVLLLGTSIWYYGITQRSDRTAGLGLALTTIRPQIALMLAIPFLFNKPRRNIWWWFCLGAALLVIISILMIGQDGVRNFLNILSVSASGEGYKINESAMVNLIGLIKRIVPDLNAGTIRIIGWTGSLIGLFNLIRIWRRTDAVTDRNISLMIILALFTSPHLHYHDLALLIIPILITIRWLVFTQKTSLRSAVLLFLCLSLLFSLVYSIPVINYAIVYLIEIVFLGSLWMVKDKSNSQNTFIWS